METRNKFIKTFLLSLAGLISSATVRAANIDMNTAQMQALDKITGQMKIIEVPVNGEVRFESFSIVVRKCQAAPQEETPENYAFVDITDTNREGNIFNIFKGWMVSSSPSLNSVEHPIYDVWLLKCFNTKDDSSRKLLTEKQLFERDKIEKYQEQEISKEAKIAQEVQKEQEKQEQLVKEQQAEQDKQKEAEREIASRQQEIEQEIQQAADVPVAEDNDVIEGEGPVSLLNLGQQGKFDSETNGSSVSENEDTPSAQESAPAQGDEIVVIEDTHHETIEQELDLPDDINEILPR